jgi:hypothetical protein
MNPSRNTPQQAHRSGRSNMYSASKFTNWSPFDPYEGERATLPRALAPKALFRLSEQESIKLYELPLHKAFVRPFTVQDVVNTLDAVPRAFLGGLQSIYLFGGTAKQEKNALGDLYRYGAYGWCEIHLYAFPRRRLRWRRKGMPKPHVRQEYERAGAVFHQDGDYVVCCFDASALRTFYLRDVLIHEVGHHVDRSHLRTGITKAERFAHWFVREHGFRRTNRAKAPAPKGS